MFHFHETWHTCSAHAPNVIINFSGGQWENVRGEKLGIARPCFKYYIRQSNSLARHMAFDKIQYGGAAESLSTFFKFFLRFTLTRSARLSHYNNAQLHT